MKAHRRVCASCEWIWTPAPGTEKDEAVACPQCGFGSYLAFYVYGRKAACYAKTQVPWIEKQVERFRAKLVKAVASRKQGLGPPILEYRQ